MVATEWYREKEKKMSNDSSIDLNDREDDFVVQMNLGGFIEDFTEVEEHPSVPVPALDETVPILRTDKNITWTCTWTQSCF